MFWDFFVIFFILFFSYAFAFKEDVPVEVTRRSLFLLLILFLVFNIPSIIDFIAALLGHIFG